MKIRGETRKSKMLKIKQTEFNIKVHASDVFYVNWPAQYDAISKTNYINFTENSHALI